MHFMKRNPRPSDGGKPEVQTAALTRIARLAAAGRKDYERAVDACIEIDELAKSLDTQELC